MRDSVVGLLLLAQWALALLWWPFRAAARLAYWTMRFFDGLGGLLVRPPYWAVVQAKRRLLGQPRWQDHDWSIGVAPPCESCGKNVPPGRHRADCAFLQPVANVVESDP